MSLTSIGNCIDDNTPFEFISVYLTCLGQGFSLSCPTDTEPAALTEAWSKILAKYRQDFSDEFCSIVAKEWGRLLKNCDPTSVEFEQQLLAAAGVSVEPLERPVGRQKKTTQADLSKTTAASNDPLTNSEISESYRQRQMAEAVTLPEIHRLSGIYAKAFKSNDPHQFLTTHLTFSKYGQPKPVPMSSVPQTIRANWERIIADEFGTIASDNFLLAITNDWFYLVNQKGLPLKPQDHYDILIAYLAKNSQPTTPNKPTSSPSFFKKMFGKD